MQLIFVRHAIAEDRMAIALCGLSDELRPLTLKGQKKMKKVAKNLKKILSHVDAIVTSPLLRAQQTSDILSEAYPKSSRVETKVLQPHTKPQEFTDWFNKNLRGLSRVIVVGHEPQMGVLISWLLAGDSGSFINLKKSGVCCLELKGLKKLGAQSAQLQFYIPPKVWC